MIGEKCLGCGYLLPGDVEVSFHGFVSLIILGKSPAAIPIAKGTVGYCQTCAATNKVPFLDGVVFSEILRAAKNEGGN